MPHFADSKASRPPPPCPLEEIDAWLVDAESAIPGIKSGTEKGIVWANDKKVRTPWAVVYIHGFSASRLETAPLADRIGQTLGANVFHTRLTGHGLPGSALGDAKVQDWMADTVEAVQIGRALGERVLVLGCSTGATLATWLAVSPDRPQADAHVYMSPNFGPKDKRLEIVNFPGGTQLVLAFGGKERRWTPENAAENQAWTSRYPTRALFPMMSLVKLVRQSDLSRFQAPVLMLYSANDQTVDSQKTRAVFARMGSSRKSIEVVCYSESIGQHVLAGAIKAPQAVAPMVATITQWVHSLI